ncbi:hypothetical protein OsI_28097 [Oryza sativa Indica Group]|uniref:Uncharacterized protein n=2 Tax=Oryza sativa TaxID=4530 RepID=B9FZF9_ORYSJ|nr:hypothetical protein OsI_28097 [Oryza sativa Indica Group]EEE68176.1 hypothetical protein OsJ_26309 [Oryza sativa Japonica Group]
MTTTLQAPLLPLPSVVISLHRHREFAWDNQPPFVHHINKKKPKIKPQETRSHTWRSWCEEQTILPAAFSCDVEPY